jgi:drug/metabolite transporter (DMT)-like permease
VTKTRYVRIRSDHAGGLPLALGIASATLFVVGWTWDHRYVPLVFAAAPMLALAGLVAFAAIAPGRDQRATVPALIGGALALLVLLGYAYALLAHLSGGN